ncbi:hypothetical protein ACMSI6_24930 [Pseudomonas antarctica]|uniref:hypothetical protein n=1 Tax=Pseudomonas antarctica TaxID=219572 RepID=UPI0039C4DFA7
MYGNKMFVCCTLLAGTVALSGCNSILQGKQYDFPPSGAPSATIRLENKHGTTLDAITFNDKGCYAGLTPLPYSGDFIESRIAVGKKLVLTYERVIGGKQCLVHFSFTPQDGATYTLKTGSWSEPKTGFLPIFNYDQSYCGIGVIKKVGDVEGVEPIQQLRIKPAGLTCLMFVK